MKCGNGAFNAQGSRVIIITGRSSENICGGSGDTVEKGKTG
jgi:predicted oxidoreductase (fatty acid repression mutant protein)